MARQSTLFEQPLARNRDEVTSFQGAEDLHTSGRWRKQLWRVFFAMRENQGHTSSELAERLDFGDRYTCSRRLGDLRRMGLTVNGEKRLCRVSGKRCLTWFCATNWGQRAAQRAKGKPEATPAPMQREAVPNTRIDEGSTASRQGQAVKPKAALPAIPGTVTTSQERREIRRRMLAMDDPKTRRFLADLAEDRP